MQLRGELSARDGAMLRALEPMVSFDPPDRGESARRFRALRDEHRDDAEIQLVSAIVSRDDDKDTAAIERAIAIDPDYADAWCTLAMAHARRGRNDEARVAFERCVAVSPHAIDAYVELAALEVRLGDHGAAERAARRALAIGPSATAHMYLLGAMHARKSRLESLRVVTRAMVAAAQADEAPILAARLDVALAVLFGDFATARARAAECNAALADVPTLAAHSHAVSAVVHLANEAGDVAGAGAAAIDFLDARAMRIESRKASADATPLCLAAARRAGLLDAATERAERADWLARSRVANELLTWGLAFAPAVDDPVALEEARRTLPDVPILPYSEPLSCADAGVVLLRLGDVDRAVTLLDVAARACVAPQDPFRSTHASLWLAEARASRGEHDLARAAAQRVLDRWGATTCTTADAARRIAA